MAIYWVPENVDTAVEEYAREVRELRIEEQRIAQRKAEIAAFVKWQAEVAWKLRPAVAR